MAQQLRKEGQRVVSQKRYRKDGADHFESESVDKEGWHNYQSFLLDERSLIGVRAEIPANADDEVDGVRYVGSLRAESPN